ncbi:MAG TPA: glycosyltransferase [Fibrobacteria bacterium]|nr:glycosyltransferase [Fibrobacteria bacterium]
MSARPRRIAYVLTAIHEGGLERFTGDLMDSLPRDEFEPVLYVLTRNNPWIGEFERRGIQIRVYPASNAVKVGSLPSLLGALWRLRADFRKDRIDLVHTCDFLPAAIGRLAALTSGVPFRVHTLHSLYEWFPKWAHVLNRWLSRTTQVITAVSQSAADSARKLESLPESKLRVVLNGADVSRFSFSASERDRVRSELGIAPEEILVGTVGSLTTRKGQEILVEAMARLPVTARPWKVAIFGAAYGGPQDNLAVVKDAIVRHGLGERIAIHPPREDVPALLSAFDIFCMPSRVEGLSLASVEAQLCRSLSVFSDIGPFREVVTDGWNGFLFRSEDPDSLAEVLCKVMGDLESLDHIRENARADALARFDKKRMTADYVGIYRNLLGTGAN